MSTKNIKLTMAQHFMFKTIQLTASYYKNKTKHNTLIQTHLFNLNHPKNIHHYSN